MTVTAVPARFRKRHETVPSPDRASLKTDVLVHMIGCSVKPPSRYHISPGSRLLHRREKRNSLCPSNQQQEQTTSSLGQLISSVKSMRNIPAMPCSDGHLIRMDSTSSGISAAASLALRCPFLRSTSPSPFLTALYPISFPPFLQVNTVIHSF